MPFSAVWGFFSHEGFEGFLNRIIQQLAHALTCLKEMTSTITVKGGRMELEDNRKENISKCYQ